MPPNDVDRVYQETMSRYPFKNNYEWLDAFMEEVNAPKPSRLCYEWLLYKLGKR